MKQEGNYTGTNIANSLCDESSLFFDPNNSSWIDLRLDQCYRKMTGPAAIMWDVTNRCNLSCLHCYNQSGSRPPVPDLTTAEMLAIGRQIIEVKPFIVCLCGGEPLLREDILEIISLLHPHVLSVNMVSNGYSLDEEMATKLVQAGIGSVQISLDGATPETHDRFRACPGSWERAVGAIKALIHERIWPPVAFIPNKFNFREIEAWGELCKELGVYNLRLMPLIPIGRAKKHMKKLVLDSEEDFLVRLAIKRFKHEHPEMQVEWGDPMSHIYNFTHSENRMRTFSVEIRPDGLLSVSSYLPLIVGDVKKYSLEAYWHAGLDRIWHHPTVLSWTESIRCLDDMARQLHQPWNNQDVFIPLLGEEETRP
jgi:MoaA/NifB/PqqE/SkfB family radical SAM enzyme